MKINTIILLVILASLVLIESRAKSSNKKNKQWRTPATVPHGALARPVVGGGVFRPGFGGVISRPYGYYGYGRPWYSSYWSPYFRWNWLYGIPGYSRYYVRRYRKSCNSICNIHLPDCDSVKSRVNEEGELKCVCLDGDEGDRESVDVPKYCWAFGRCVRSINGCSSFRSAIENRIEETKRRR